MSPVQGSGLSKRSPEPLAASSFRFLDLPGEIRNRIYCYCVIEPQDCPHEHTTRILRTWVGDEHYLVDNSPNLPRFLPSAACLICIAIVRACKQINNEAVPLLLAANTWRVTGLEGFRDNLLGPLTPGRVQILRKLHMEVNNHGFFWPLHVGGEDNCYLHVELARIFCSDQPALKALHGFQIFLYFEDEDCRPESDYETDDEESSTSEPEVWELHPSHTRDTLIVQRAMYNLVRLNLFDQHHLTTSIDVVGYVETNSGQDRVRKYAVTLTRTDTEEVGSFFPSSDDEALILPRMR